MHERWQVVLGLVYHMTGVDKVEGLIPALTLNVGELDEEYPVDLLRRH